MGNNNYLKIVYVVLFALLAYISCWATTESLHLLLPSWPIAFCWAITIAFFIIASWGTKLIVDSLNSNIYLENRTLRLIGGFIILIIFWLLCSMPTNTHTFFYRSVIESKVSQDLSNTKSYLAQIRDNTQIENLYNDRATELKNKVDIKLAELEAEIKNSVNPGFGPKAESILRDFASMLDVAVVEPLSIRGTVNSSVRNALIDAYRQKIYMLMEAKKQSIANELRASDQDTYTKQAKVDWDKLDEIERAIEDGTIDLNKAEDINSINNDLTKGYATIRTYATHVAFNSSEDLENYTSDNQVTKVKRMLSVIDVWKDFIGGKYAGQGFFFWVLLSVLVDIAAFIFFDMAFKER